MVMFILVLSCQICSVELDDSLCPILLWWAQILAEFHVVLLYLAVITVVFSISDRSSLWEWLIMPGTLFHLSSLFMISRNASLSPFLSTKIPLIAVSHMWFTWREYVILGCRALWYSNWELIFCISCNFLILSLPICKMGLRIHKVFRTL